MPNSSKSRAKSRANSHSDQPSPEHSGFAAGFAKTPKFDPKTILRMLPRLLAQNSRAEQLGNGFVKTQIKLLAWSLSTGVSTLNAVQGVMQDALLKLQQIEATRQENDQPEEW